MSGPGPGNRQSPIGNRQSGSRKGTADRRLPTAGPSAAARETKFAEAELSEVAADGSFCGYASLFGEADLSRDMVMPGAFRKSSRRAGRGCRVRAARR